VSLIWLSSACSVGSAVSDLEESASQLALDEIYFGNTLTTMFNAFAPIHSIKCIDRAVQC
jgi:hypothetical protein